ncbi:MAG: DUF5320 domain-containing protein [Rectinema sp.]
MPYLDGTGPMGRGPLTGRGLGYCGAGLGLGCGRRMGAGRLRGYGWRSAEWGAAWGGVPYSPMTEDIQKQALVNEQKALEMRLEALKAQIEALEKERSENPSA